MMTWTLTLAPLVYKTGSPKKAGLWGEHTVNVGECVCVCEVCCEFESLDETPCM